MSDETTKFCISFVTCNVAYHGLSLFVAAWNHHSMPGKCNDVTDVILITHALL